jgi:pyruvate-ferredoxin/flavodoxin oxidoreductase
MDLSLAARVIAERALVPVVVVVDRTEILERSGELLVPDDELIGIYLGTAETEIDCPTPSQRMLFGEKRRSVPRWFDPDRPAATGLEPAAGEYDAAIAGRRAFFSDHFLDVAAPAFDVLGQLTGRPIDALTQYQGGGARHLIVTQGSATVDVERVIAERSHKRIGVIGLTRNRPFPEAELQKAIRGAESVTVLERVDDSEMDRPPLFRDVRSVLGAESCRMLSATFHQLKDPQLDALIENIGRGDSAQPVVRLGLESQAGRSEYPRRQVLLESIRREYPQLDERTLPDQGMSTVSPERMQAAPPLPWVVRRFDQIASTYDSVSRFWGEYSEPREQGGEGSVPDPYLALGVLPSCTATFHDRSQERESVPIIDPAACTGCGKCWSACPDSALTPLALGTQQLLDAAFDATAGASVAESGAAKLKRAHKQFAARLDGSLAKDRTARLGVADLDLGFAWLVEKMGLDGKELQSAQGVFDRSKVFLDRLGLSTTETMFHSAHREQKGTGSLLMLAVDPRSCQGCGICAAVCEDDAIETCPQTDESLHEMRDRLQAWEKLPDTSGKTIQRLSEVAEPGKLASVLLSRHCSMAVTGADGSEPGSGARLATKQVIAVVEYEMQQRWLRQAAELEELAGDLHKAIASSLERKLPDDNLQLLDRLEELAGPVDINKPRVRELTRAARSLERVRWRLTEGRQGLGRARYGLAIMGRGTAEWAIPYPRNPFSVPVVVDASGEGPELAFGVAGGMLAEMIEDFREIRHARLVLEQPAGQAERIEALGRLSRGDLTPEERALCPPLLILTDPETLASAHVAGLARLLSSDLPVKVLLFDGRDLPAGGADPALLALAHRQAFVLSSSVAHPEHLFPGMQAALDFTGSALIHIHTPSPRTHGFEPAQLMERARQAVESRVHPLLRYDPSAPGVFGRRLSLEGNDSMESDWVEGNSPAVWTGGEARFADLSRSKIDAIVSERHDHWSVLQELAGVVTPFTETIRQQLERDVRDEQEGAIESLTRVHEDELQDVKSRQRQEQAVRLRERLMQLAGYNRDPPS